MFKQGVNNNIITKMNTEIARRCVSCLLCTAVVLGMINICSVSAAKPTSPKLIVTNDGPAILDSNITFNATLKYPDRADYVIYWNELGPFGKNKEDVLNSTNNYTSTWNLLYASKDKYQGQFALSVQVGYFFIHSFFVSVDTQIVRYTITDTFDGSLDVYQNGKLHVEDPALIATKNEVTLIANVHDPSHYLKTASNLTYSWYNKTNFITNTTTEVLKQNFTQEGQFSYNVTLYALFNSTNVSDEADNSTGVIKTGFYKTDVIVKTAIVNFTVAGPTWFPHGKLLKLNVSCAGSGPYSYCWTLKPGPYNQTGNETCGSDPTSTNDCDFPITRYFQNPGIYSLLVIVQNDVSRVVNQSTINVYIVHRKQQLSIIVVPVSCSIIAVVLIVFGIAYYLEHQVKYTVEVADFDFGQDTDLPYMTFFERLRNAMSTTNTGGSNALLIPSTSEDEDAILTSP